jgi:hypothetical protein
MQIETAPIVQMLARLSSWLKKQRLPSGVRSGKVPKRRQHLTRNLTYFYFSPQENLDLEAAFSLNAEQEKRSLHFKNSVDCEIS